MTALLANVTVTIDNRDPAMPRSRLDRLPLSAAERQARHRARLRQAAPNSTPIRVARPCPRPQRWAAAVATLVSLQDEYRAWLDNLPKNLGASLLAEKLEAITELDLEELQAIDPPRGYGRD